MSAGQQAARRSRAEVVAETMGVDLSDVGRFGRFMVVQEKAGRGPEEGFAMRFGEDLDELMRAAWREQYEGWIPISVEDLDTMRSATVGLSYPLSVDVERVQAQRDERYRKLIDHYGPADDLTPARDADEQYVLVEEFDAPNHAGGKERGFSVFTRLGYALAQAGRGASDRWDPVAIFDLADGRLIDVHVADPVVTVADDQDITPNPLDEADAEAVAR